MQRSNLHTIVARIFGYSHDCRGVAIRAKALLGLLRTCLLLGSVSGRGHLVAGSWAVARLGSQMLPPVPLLATVPICISTQKRLAAIQRELAGR